MTSGKIFANGYNEIMMNVFHFLEYNASLGPQHLSNDASFVIFLRKRRRTQTYQNHCICIISIERTEIKYLKM